MMDIVNQRNFDIEVLMSTYNGEKYIVEQLDSIVDQENVSIKCLIRDDLSNDKTVERIEHYRQIQKNIQLIIGIENLGFARSFYELVKLSDDFEFYAFSDQDDVWMPLKIKTGIEHIQEYSDIPCMYFSNCELVHFNLNHLGNMYKEVALPECNFQRLLENLAVGCTIVFNKKAKEMFLKADPMKIQFHDFWMYVICSYFGRVVYDSTPQVKYRQHGNNQVGNKPSLRQLWKQRLKQLKRKDAHIREYMAQELLKGFSDLLSDEDVYKLRIVANYRNSMRSKMKLLFSRDIRMNEETNLGKSPYLDREFLT